LTEDKLALTFGALLHDIGKVVYRGSSAKGTHSKLGADFIEELAAQNADFEGMCGQKIVEQIRYHHAKEMSSASRLDDDSLAFVTYFADNISAGMDRKNEGDEQAAHFDRDVKLRKIFNIINGRHSDATIEHEDYNTIRERIHKGLAGMRLRQSDLNSLLNLLEATTDKVPSSTNLTELVDVSLFDHAKTTAAIAVCIYEYLSDHGILNYREALFDRQRSPRFYEEPMFLLCSWDMSGIQSFIYNISGAGALKQLRARSLYLELMLEHVSDELLERLELSRANLLYTGGGHAYLLLPNTRQTKTIFGTFCDELREWLIEHYGIDLYLATSLVECSAHDLANKGEDKQRYPKLYQELSEGLSAAKASRYDARTIKELNFGSAGEYDHSRECKECHRSDADIDENDLCPLCASLGKISASLIHKDVFVIAEAFEGEDTVSPGRIGLALPFDRRLEMYSRDEYLATRPVFARIYTKNSWDMGVKLSTHLWMGDYTVDTGKVGISAYAGQGSTLEEDYGIKRLGVLRADVDNLGTVFASGIPVEKASISRTSTLSRALSYFFKYRINGILEEGQYQAQIIYSGGDDLFLIGNWNDIIHAARDIRREFLAFTGNDSITISAGIGMFDEKYPIASMAAKTGELEDAAKKHKTGGEVTKDAVALWSDQAVFGWDDFESTVAPKLGEIRELFDKNEKGKALIYKLIALLRGARDQVSLPRLAYLLARSFEDEGDGAGESSMRIYAWATDVRERAALVTALEWYVYSIREKG
jgi:hypothetical protein